MSLAELGIVDTHFHLWQIGLARQTWLTPEFKHLFRSFEPEDLAQASGPVGIRAAVLVESGETAEENRSIEQMVASSDLIKIIIPFADLESSKLDEELDYWQRNPKFRGVRMRFEGHPDPGIAARPSVVAGLSKIAQRGLIFDFLVQSHHLADVLNVFARLPDLKGVIEHMAKPDMVGGSDSEEWHQRMKELAKNTSVACKLSLSPRQQVFGEHLANPGQGWPVELIKPYVQFLLDQFGPDRLMWGSDWPIALVTSDYEGIHRAMREAIGPIKPDDELRLFRTTAAKFYGIAD